MDPSTDEHEHKLVSYKTYINVWLALVFLTFITVAVSFTDMKHMTIFTAVFIAMIKSTLVMLYFMNIRFERPVFTWFIVAAFGTYVIFVILTFADYSFR